MIKVELNVKSEIIKESLSRMGIANRKDKILYPSCYLIERNNENFIAHFKELFSLVNDNAYNNCSEEDYVRRNAIIFCLKNWNLIDVDETEIVSHDRFVFVLPFKEKSKWNISHKFNTLLLNGGNNFG